MGTIVSENTCRDPLAQFDAGAIHADTVSKIFVNCANEKRKPNANEVLAKKKSTLTLQKCCSRAGYISPYLVFDRLYEKGMDRW